MTATIRERLEYGRSHVSGLTGWDWEERKKFDKALADLAAIDAALGASKPKVPMAMIHELMELGAHRYGENREQPLKVQILKRYGFEVDDSEGKKNG